MWCLKDNSLRTTLDHRSVFGRRIVIAVVPIGEGEEIAMYRGIRGHMRVIHMASSACVIIPEATTDIYAGSTAGLAIPRITDRTNELGKTSIAGLDPCGKPMCIKA